MQEIACPSSTTTNMAVLMVLMGVGSSDGGFDGREARDGTWEVLMGLGNLYLAQIYGQISRRLGGWRGGSGYGSGIINLKWKGRFRG